MNKRRFTRLKALRLTLGLSSEQMADFIGIDKTRYSRIENFWEVRATRKLNERFVSALGEGFDFMVEPVELPELEVISQRIQQRVA